MPQTRVGAVLVAAGRGTRMGNAEPKQFTELGGRALFLYALATLVRSAHVGKVVVVVPEVEEERARSLCADALPEAAQVAVVTGGDTRQESVRRGLRVVRSYRYVVVHDAARPFATQEQVARVVSAARQHGAASIALPLNDTLVRATAPDDVSRQPTLQRLERQGVWAVQTPQAFERELLERAHEHARAHDLRATDDGGLVLELGHSLQLVEGSWYNIKLTTPEDWERARWILESGAFDPDA